MHHQPRANRRHRLGLVALVGVCALVAQACGNRLDHSKIVAASAASGKDGSAGSSSFGESSSDNGTGASLGAGEQSGTGTATGGAGAGATAGRGASSGSQTGTGGSGANASVAGLTTPGQTGPIVIGSVGHQSGIPGAAGADMARSVRLWASLVNKKGGLFGRPVQVIVVDDGGDPARFQAGLQDLVENRHVVAFVGNYAAQTADAGDAYLTKAKVPVIGTDCTRPLYEKSPNYFDECGSANISYTGPLKAGIKAGTGNKLGLLYCGEAQVCKDGAAGARQGAASSGMTVVYDAQVSLTQPDFTAECISARNAGADVIFPVTDGTAAERIGASCTRQNYKPTFIFAANVNKDAPSKTGLENAVVALPAFPFTSSPAASAQEFYKAWADGYGGIPQPSGATGWASAKLFELIATKAVQTSHSLTPETLFAAGRTIKGETLGGLTTTLDFSAPGRNAFCYWVLHGKGGGWEVLNGGNAYC
jgi:branched-chain amino acid transport system substrate-binding protein